MNYGYQMAPAQQQFTRIVKRPLTDVEKGFVIKSYKSIQNGLRAVSIISLVLFIVNAFVIADIALDWEVQFLFGMLMVVFGAISLGMTANLFMTRNRMMETYRDGTAIEIQAPAYRGGMMKNAQSWTVGPAMIMATPDVSKMLMVGTMATAVCAPKLKMVISINYVGLKQMTRVTLPPNIDSMAEQLFQPEQQMAPAQPQYPQPYGQPMAQQPIYSQEEPPPPPDF